MLSAREICGILFSRPDGGSTRAKRAAKNARKRYHPFYEAEAELAVRERNALQLRLVDERALAIYRRCELIVMERLPFSFCERRLVRLNSRLTPVSVETIMVHLQGIQARVEASVTATLPSTFGLVLDGWTSGSRHYVAIFAVFSSTGTGMQSSTVPNTGTAPNTGMGSGSSDYFDDLHCHDRRFLLLAFRPLDDEQDLGAQSMFDHIADTLSRYDKPWEAVAFTVGDNCSVNQYIGRRVGGIPLIGCASHRFQLAVKDFLADEEALITKVHALVTKLRTLKGRAILHRVSPLAPLLRNDTRWSSTYAMLQRYIDLVHPIGQIGNDVLTESDIQPLLLRRADTERVRALLVDMEKFQAVTNTLQRSTITLSAVRRLFDHVIKSYPQMETRLSATAAIINYPALGTGLVKLQRQEALALSERQAVAAFKIPESAQVEEATGEQVESFVASAFKRRKTTRRAQYVDVAYVPPTSNECERFFSAAKLVFSDLRKRMEPDTLEMVMLLMLNKQLWTAQTVQDIRVELGTNN